MENEDKEVYEWVLKMSGLSEDQYTFELWKEELEHMDKKYPELNNLKKPFVNMLK